MCITKNKFSLISHIYLVFLTVFCSVKISDKMAFKKVTLCLEITTIESLCSCFMFFYLKNRGNRVKFKHCMKLLGLAALLSSAILSATVSSAQSNSLASIPAPDIRIMFESYNESMETYAAPNPLLIFFKVSCNAISTRDSRSYSNFARLIAHTGISFSDLQKATSGMSLSDGHCYIALDQTVIPLLATGAFAINHEGLPAVIGWVQQLTVVQAWVLDNEFVILAFDKNGKGVPTTFAKVATWKETVDHLSVGFMSQVYQD